MSALAAFMRRIESYASAAPHRLRDAVRSCAGVRINIGCRTVFGLALCGFLLNSELTHAATMYSTKDSYMTAGVFYGPGRIKDSVLFDATIIGIGLTSTLNFVTPFVNNLGGEPNVCADKAIRGLPTGLLSDGVTKINESVDVCAFDLNGAQVLVAIIDGGPHAGQQIAVTLDDTGEPVMVMTMDFAIDMGIGKGGVIRMPFYGTTAEVTVPRSLQGQMGIEGGVDKAGSLASGDKLRGRLGDFNNDGMLDGAIVVAGNIPLNSIFMPGAPYALIRYFETDMPYDGLLLGKLPGSRHAKSAEPPPLTVTSAKGRGAR